ncbi:MAG: hypothetical protein P4L69_05475 [Desulfosporosinus sp.]|nr:hypothetical protein [Desulfosporosinus sp.]
MRNNCELIKALALSEDSIRSINHLLFSGIIFKNPEKLFTVPDITTPPYDKDVADACGFFRHMEDEMIDERLDCEMTTAWQHFHIKAVIFHPVTKHAYMEFVMDREPGTNERYCFRPCADDDCSTEDYSLIDMDIDDEEKPPLPLVYVNTKLAVEMMSFLIASGMVYSYSIESECVL